jgi:phosphoribosyl 1,2-cyclic phosphodiesterase
MKVTIWGCRGSITAPGKDTLRYGGESSCFEILTDDGETIIIDAGSGIRKLGNKLIKEAGKTQLTLLMTHAHWDHLAGFPFFKPAFSPRYSISVCGGPDAQDSVMKCLRHQMEPPYFPVDMSAMKASFGTGCRCGCADCDHRLPGLGSSHRCEAIPLNHPNGGWGFKLTGRNGHSFVLLTDNEIRYHHETGRSREEYVDFCRGAELLFHDAQYTEEEYAKTVTWGHSTYRDAVDIAIDAGVKRLGLLHHDPERSDDEIDRHLAWCRGYIAERKSSLECFACAEGMTSEV